MNPMGTVRACGGVMVVGMVVVVVEAVVFVVGGPAPRLGPER